MGSTLDLPMLCCPGWLLTWKLEAKSSPSGLVAGGTSVTEAVPKCRLFISQLVCMSFLEFLVEALALLHFMTRVRNDFLGLPFNSWLLNLGKQHGVPASFPILNNGCLLLWIFT